MELENVFTAGTEGIPICGDRKRSSINVPSNEDWQMVVEVTGVEEGIVAGKKVWEQVEQDYTIFYARLEYAGISGTPPEDSVKVGQHVIFSRVGDFASTGVEGYELREENQSKCSWVCLIEAAAFIYVRDSGEGTATEVVFDENGDTSVPEGAQSLPIKTLDPIGFFHDSLPPFANGRVYPAQKIKDEEGNSIFYLVFLPAKGNLAKSFISSAETVQFRLDVDGQGNVLDFFASTIG